MYYQQKGFRNIFTGLQLAALCSITIALATAPMARAQACIQPPTGTMVAWYSFDDQTPTGPSTNLATQNAAVWDSPTLPVYNSSGKVAGALNFNGNSYIDAPDSIVTNFGPAGGATCGGDYSTCKGDFSIDVWIYLNPGALPLSGLYTILDKRNSAGTGYLFYLYGDPAYDNGNPWMGLNLGDARHGATAYGSQGLASPSGVGITTGSWNHLAVTVSRRSGILWYFNGVQLGPETTPITQTGSLLTTSPLRIGAFDADSGGGNYFAGSLDELQIFNTVLTGPQVAAIAAAPVGQCK